MENFKKIDFDKDNDYRQRSDGEDINDDSSCSSSISEIGSGYPATISDDAARDSVRDREERLLQWLNALDVQVVGACRVDERLKPMLLSSAPCGHAEDRLLAHLNQNFEPSEVGMLARCFCVPLVSLRVGKIEKQGTLFLPTTYRGNLNVMVLPTSDLHLVFVGDDGNTERLFSVRNKLQGPVASLEEIPNDSSGRSFRIKVSDGRDFFFWCSEKSKLLGFELLAKMKDILETKPSISVLSGIDQLRLDCLAIHLHAYLLGCNAREITACSSSSTPSDASSGTPKRSRHAAILSPRPSSFKEGRRDKLRRRNDGILSAVDNLVSAQTRTEDVSAVDNLPSCPPLCHQQPQSIRKLGDSLLKPESCDPLLVSSPFSPHYCWCPPDKSPSPLDFIASIESSRSSTSFSPPFDFPALLPALPLTNSQQFPSFTPLICDPIVHVPVIDVCSAGQGYFVSAGAVIQNSVTPLMPSFVNPLAPETEAVLEQGARETLRLLISSSSKQNSHGMDVSAASMLSNCEVAICSADVDLLAESFGPMKLCDLDVVDDLDEVDDLSAKVRNLRGQ